MCMCGGMWYVEGGRDEMYDAESLRAAPRSLADMLIVGGVTEAVWCRAS